jgi:hypothetical protein
VTVTWILPVRLLLEPRVCGRESQCLPGTQVTSGSTWSSECEVSLRNLLEKLIPEHLPNYQIWASRGGTQKSTAGHFGSC